MFRAGPTILHTNARLFKPEAREFISRLTTKPDQRRSTLIDDQYRRFMDSPLWLKADAIYLFAAHSESAALINWKAPGTYDCTQSGTPTTHTVDRGFTGNGTSSYIDTNFNPTTAVSANCVQDSAHLGAWFTVNAQLSQDDCGTGGSVSGALGLRARNTSDQTIFNANGTAAATITSSTDSTGHWITRRVDASNHRLFRNGAAFVANTARASGAMHNGNFRYCGRGGSVVQYSTRLNSVGHFGGGLTDAEVPYVYAAILPWMQAVGAV